MTTKISFPGIRTIYKFSYTLSLGVTPGVIELEVEPQSFSFPLVGAFSATYLNRRLVVSECRVVEGSFQFDSNGKITSLKLLDGRWKWLYGSVWHQYNRPEGENRFISDSRASPQKMAEVLLEAMGERNYDVSRLPRSVDQRDIRYKAEWNGENPALELAKLAEAYGCVVTYEPTTRHTALWRRNEGQPLPGIPKETVLKESETLAPQKHPYQFTFFAGKTQCQYSFDLRAVGKEVDGTIKPIDDLSYKPSRGWGVQNDVFGDITDRRHYLLAQQTVWKWYQIWVDDNAHSVQIPGVGKATAMHQVLPLETQQFKSTIGLDGVRRRNKAVVYGLFWTGNIGRPNNYTSFTTVVPHDFNINTEDGVVEFSKPVKKWDNDNSLWIPATLYLDVGFHLRDRYTGEFHRYTRDYNSGFRYNSPSEPIVDEKIAQMAVYDVDMDNVNLPVWRDRESIEKCRRRANDAFKDKLATYQLSDSINRRYEGLVTSRLNGKINQIEWSYDTSNGTETEIGQNCEFSLYVPSFQRRRQHENLRQLLENKKYLYE